MAVIRFIEKDLFIAGSVTDNHNDDQYDYQNLKIQYYELKIEHKELIDKHNQLNNEHNELINKYEKLKKIIE